MYRIDPARADLAREYKARPTGPHGAELQKLLLILRWGGVRGKTVMLATKPDREWRLAKMGPKRGAPMTEYGDRINQLDLSVSKSFKYWRATFQPKIDFFNLLNVSPVTDVRGLNYGTPAYYQPSVVLVGRVYQLGAIVRF